MQASLADDNAFATFVATLQFTGADLLGEAEQPTFIWNINPEMTPGHDNIFGNARRAVLRLRRARSCRGSRSS